MATFKTSLYFNYSDAYSDIVSQIKGASSTLSPAQIADCLEALATIAPGKASPTGSVAVTPPSYKTPIPGNPTSANTTVLS